MFRYLIALLFLTAFATPLPISLAFLKPLIFSVSLVCLIALFVRSGQLWRPDRPSAMFAIGACAMIALAAARGYYPDDRSFNYLIATTAVVCIAPFMKAVSSDDMRALVRALYYLNFIWIILLLVTQAVDRSVFGELSYKTSTPSEWYQGYSFIFGLTAILSFAYARNESLLCQLIAYSFGTLSLLMSLYMGGRGESIFAILTCVLMVRGRAVVGVLLASVGAILFVPTIQRYLLLLPALQRIDASLQKDDYGMRDVLFSHGVDVLMNNASVILFGGGANFFQNIFYHGEFGSYPHNTMLEAMITFGVIAGAYYGWIFFQHIALFLIYCIGGAQNKDLLTLSAVAAYLGLLALKSGSMWNVWFLYFLVLVHPQTRFGFSNCSRPFAA